MPVASDKPPMTTALPSMADSPCVQKRECGVPIALNMDRRENFFPFIALPTRGYPKLREFQ